MLSKSSVCLIFDMGSGTMFKQCLHNSYIWKFQIMSGWKQTGYTLCNLHRFLLNDWLQPVTLLNITLLHGCFSCFLTCTNGTKLRKASHIFWVTTNVSRDVLHYSRYYSSSWHSFCKLYVEHEWLLTCSQFLKYLWKILNGPC